MGYSRKGGLDCQSRRVSFVSTSKRSRKGRLPSGDAPPPMRQQGQLSASLSNDALAALMRQMRGQHMLPELPGLPDVSAQEIQNRQSGHTQDTATCKASASTVLSITLNYGGIAMTGKQLRQVGLSRSVSCKHSACALGFLRTGVPALATQAASPCMMSWPVPSTRAMT